jgi:hypothetical protein
MQEGTEGQDDIGRGSHLKKEPMSVSERNRERSVHRKQRAEEGGISQSEVDGLLPVWGLKQSVQGIQIIGFQARFRAALAIVWEPMASVEKKRSSREPL